MQYDWLLFWYCCFCCCIIFDLSYDYFFDLHKNQCCSKFTVCIRVFFAISVSLYSQFLAHYFRYAIESPTALCFMIILQTCDLNKLSSPLANCIWLKRKCFRSGNSSKTIFASSFTKWQKISSKYFPIWNIISVRHKFGPKKCMHSKFKEVIWMVWLFFCWRFHSWCFISLE